MRPLLERVPGLAHLALAELPTPVERLEALGPHVWVKRDDQTGSPAIGYGGNKVRKLEFLLAEALGRRRRAVMTVGAAGSNHVLATALYARAAGLEPAAVLFPQPDSDEVRARGRLFSELGLRRSAVPGKLAVPLGALALGLRSLVSGHGWPAWVPAGGSSVTGALGFVNAGLELGEQVRAGLLPAPARLYVPLGSAGTAAGLMVGLGMAGLSTTVCAVQVVPPPWMTARACLRLAAQIARRLGGAPVAPVEVVTSALGPGYGVATAEARAAVARAEAAGLAAETTYGGKALAALFGDAARHPGEDLLFWHTYSRYRPPA